MPLPIIAGLARIAAAAARAAPAIARGAAGAARSFPVHSWMRSGFRGVSHAAMRVAPALDTISTFTSRVERGSNAVAGFAGTVVSAGQSLLTLPDRITRFGDSVVAAQRHLAMYNGAMGVATMRLGGERYRRDLQMSARVQGSYGALTQSQSQLEQAWLPLRASAQNATNAIATTVNKMGTSLAEALTGMGLLLSGHSVNRQAIKEANKDKDIEGGILVQHMNRIARGDYSKRRMPVLGDPKTPENHGKWGD